MITIIYFHKEKSMKEEFFSSKGFLSFHKDDKSFSCDASDLDCAGVPDLPHEFILKIAENGHSRVFKYVKCKQDEEGETQYWLYRTDDGITFTVFND